MRIPLTLIGLCIANIVLAQSIKGKIIDSKTKEPIPYVHIGIIGKAIGTVSNEQGVFKMDLRRASSKDSLAFSSIGYERQAYQVSEVSSADLAIKLVSVSYDLNEIVIKDNVINEMVIGRRKIGNDYTGSTEIGWGGEIGITIKSDGKRRKVKDVNFNIMAINYDSLLFRVNMYTTKDGLPHKSILKSPIFITGLKGQEWVSKNLTSENIYFSDDIIATVESIRGWPTNKAGYGVFYCNGKGYKSNTYHKEASMSNWTTGKEPKLTLYMTTLEVSDD